MKVTVRFLGPIKEAVGEQERTLDLKKGTAKELISIVIRMFPNARKKLELAGIFIKGRIVTDTELQASLLKEGDEVSIVLPVAGG